MLRVLNVRAAWFAAALFALHPVQVESVAWISERKNVLMGFFFLAALLGWLRFIEEKPGRAWRWLALSFFLYLLALSAKTTACTFPAALVLVLWWKRKPITGLRWLQISPFVLAGAGAGVISMLWERIHQGGRPDYIPIGLLERVLIFSRAIWFYLSKLAWPSELIFSYPRWNISPSDPVAYIWVVALVVLIGAIFYTRRWLGRGPEVAFAFFVLTLSPLLGLVIVVTFLFSFVADHYQYLACIGPLALFAAGCDLGVGRLSWPGKTWLGRAGAGLILAALTCLTWQQSKIYRNEESLWRHTIAHNPASWMSRNNLAGYWLKQKRFAEAIEQSRKVIELRPNDSLGYLNLGAALAREGDPAGAIQEYEHALALKPNDARIERNLAQALAEERRFDDAIAHFQRTVELRKDKPGDGQGAELQVEFGNALLKKGDAAAAMTHYREALALRPDSAAAHNNLGNALLQEGAMEEARRQFDEARNLSPAGEQNAEVYCNLGNAALQKRDLESAVANYQRALAIRPNYAEAHSNLGTAFLIQGKMAKAIREFEATLAIAPQSAPTLNNLARLLATGPEVSLRDGARAARLAQQAIDLSRGRDPASYRALAAALAEQGQFEDASKAAARAIEFAGESNPGFTAVLRREEAAYRNHEKAPAH